MDKDLAKRRLQHPDGAALRALAQLVVDETTATPMKDIATPEWLASQITAGLEAATRGDRARSWVEGRIEAGRGRWGEEEQKLSAFLPEEAERPLRDLLAREYTPDEDLTYRLIDHTAVRNLVRTVLTSSLTRFAKRLRTPKGEAGVWGDLGQRAAKRGRKLFGGVAENLGGLAENLVGAVRDELDGVMQGRVAEFADKATAEAMRYIAGHISDPANATGFGEFRIALLEVVLDTPIATLTREMEKLGPEELVEVVVVAIRSALDDEHFVQQTEERITQTLDETGDGTLGAWLDEVGLLQVWSESTTELVARRLQAVVSTPGFEAWWESLFQP